MRKKRTLGVIIHQTLKSKSQCVAASNLANRTLGMINRIIVNKDSKTLLKLYQSLVRPKLEYYVQAWRAYLQKHIDPLQKLQRRATWMMTNDKCLSYYDRLTRAHHRDEIPERDVAYHLTCLLIYH